MSRYKEMLVWFHEHETTDRAALVGALTHGRSCNDGGEDVLENAFRAIAADLMVLSTLIGADNEEAHDLNPEIIRLFIDGVETRARAAAGIAKRLSQEQLMASEREAAQ